MHILTLPNAFRFPAGQIDAGEYVLNGAAAGYLLAAAEQGSIRPLNASRPFDESQDWNGKRILFMRTGGFGDLLLLTPVLREIKRRWPFCTIGVSTLRHYGAVLQNLPFVDGVAAFPLPLSEAEKFDAWVFFDSVIEHDPRARTMHLTDLFAEVTGLHSIENKQPAYQVTPREIGWCMEQYPRKSSARRLCIHPGSTAVCRRWPGPHFAEVASRLVDKGWEIYFLGQKGEIGVEKHVGYFDLSDAGLTFRQSCAVLNNADCLLGADSAMVHVAGALGVPAVAIYGPFPWALRTAYSPSVTAIQGSCPISPCFHHVNTLIRNNWPDKCPSGAGGFCQALAEVQPSRVTTRIELCARKFEPMEIVDGN
jgi:ADP-heptose:LPS heptosyltransferase